MFGKSCYSLVRGVVGLTWVLIVVISLGCSVQATDNVSEEDAAMGAEFGRVYIKPGTVLYTLQLDDIDPAGRLIQSRTIDKGGFVALIAHSDADVTQGHCSRFQHGVAAIELPNENRSPTFFVDTKQLVGAAIVNHDPKGIGIRTRSLLSTATFDSCGSVHPLSVSVTNTALLRPVVDTFGRTLPMYLDVTSVEPLRLIPATETIEALDICIPDRFWDSAAGQALASITDLFTPHSASDECILENQTGHFVAMTRGDAERLIGSPQFAELEARMFGTGALEAAPQARGIGSPWAVIGGLVIAGLMAGGVIVLPRINLPAPVVLLSKALTATVPEAGAQAHRDLMQDQKQNFRHICAAFCADDIGAPNGLPQGLSYHAARYTTPESIAAELNAQAGQGQPVEFAFGTGSFPSTAQANAIKNLHTFRASKPAPLCVQPQIAFCINH